MTNVDPTFFYSPEETIESIVSPQHFVEMYMTTEATTTTMAGPEGEEESQRLQTAIIHRRNSVGYTVDDGKNECIQKMIEKEQVVNKS